MTLMLELNPEEEARLEAVSRLLGVDPTAYAKMLVTEHLPAIVGEQLDAGNHDRFSGKTIAEIIESIGTVDGLPADLSTNPQYLRGFGETKDVRNSQS
jgi:hypothetical protein